jgi:hypothetical protein
MSDSSRRVAQWGTPWQTCRSSSVRVSTGVGSCRCVATSLPTNCPQKPAGPQRSVGPDAVGREAGRDRRETRYVALYRDPTGSQTVSRDLPLHGASHPGRLRRRSCRDQGRCQFSLGSAGRRRRLGRRPSKLRLGRSRPVRRAWCRTSSSCVHRRRSRRCR